MYGREKVLAPPGAAVYDSAWKTAQVAELHLPTSPGKVESRFFHVTALKIYWLGLTLSVVAGLWAGIAAALKPIQYDVDTNREDHPKTYLQFFRLSLGLLGLSAIWWIGLIIMSRKAASKAERAGGHVSAALTFGSMRFFEFLNIWLPKRSETFSGVISSCTTSNFQHVECAPIGIFFVIPLVEIVIYFGAALFIYLRAVALHGRAKIVVEPAPAPTHVPAWKLSKVIDVDLPGASPKETDEALVPLV
ncbi:hypothetical protein DFH06DRAFT_1184904 [Mycena polygramma]|nr:hypothetical protein DFH06DRAFT_1184904 [Mycena polygramma]